MANTQNHPVSLRILYVFVKILCLQKSSIQPSPPPAHMALQRDDEVSVWRPRPKRLKYTADHVRIILNFVGHVSIVKYVCLKIPWIASLAQYCKNIVF
jgi:hypothetical protein